MRRVLADERTPESTRRSAIEVVAEIDGWLDDEGRPTARRRLSETKSRLARLRNRLLTNRLYYDEPPAEIAAAFPELSNES
jgi:hypothetical protein